LVSDIADFDTKEIKFDEVVANATSLIEKKNLNKTKDMWSTIISNAGNQQMSPTTELEALHYEDRREFFKTFTEKLSQIRDLRDAVSKAKNDGNDTTDLQPNQVKLNNMILQTDMDLEQIDDSLLESKKFIEFFETNVKNKDFFKAALAYQEVVKQSYQTFYL
jgi:hypothetical protein